MTCQRIELALDDAFKAHATFCRTGRPCPTSRGIMTRILGQSPSKVVHLEQEVESIICRMAQVNLLAADVLRMEYGAGWQTVIKRRKAKVRNFLWLEATQEQKAAILGINEHLYRSFVRNARQSVLEALTK